MRFSEFDNNSQVGSRLTGDGIRTGDSRTLMRHFVYI